MQHHRVDRGLNLFPMAGLPVVGQWAIGRLLGAVDTAIVVGILSLLDPPIHDAEAQVQHVLCALYDDAHSTVWTSARIKADPADNVVMITPTLDRFTETLLAYMSTDRCPRQA